MKSLKFLTLALIIILQTSCSENDEVQPNESVLKSSPDIEKISSVKPGERLMGNCENRGFDPEPSVPEGSCCMEFQVLESTPELPWEYWYCIVEEEPNVWVTYRSSDYPNGTFDVCFEEDDHFYQYSITYVDAVGNTVCESKNQLVYNEKGCLNDFRLCWSATNERSFQAFDTVGGMIITDNDGMENDKDVLFDPELPISTLQQYIFDTFEAALTTAPYNLDPNQVELVSDCLNCAKATTPQDGFFVYGANFKKLTLYGTDDDGKEIEVDFYTDECAEE